MTKDVGSDSPTKGLKRSRTDYVFQLPGSQALTGLSRNENERRRVKVGGEKSMFKERLN